MTQCKSFIWIPEASKCSSAKQVTSLILLPVLLKIAIRLQESLTLWSIELVFPDAKKQDVGTKNWISGSGFISLFTLYYIFWFSVSASMLAAVGKCW